MLPTNESEIKRNQLIFIFISWLVYNCTFLLALKGDILIIIYLATYNEICLFLLFYVCESKKMFSILLAIQGNKYRQFFL